ncbi:HRSL1 enzyme, partial [Sylvietta virens]|nr:HRSL1 enzyme [Sylvietta virens]
MGQSNCHPQPGDLIEIKRSLIYQHWALYVGDGYVIHVADIEARSGLGSSSPMFAKGAKVKKELLTEVARNDKWVVNNKYDRKLTPLPVEKIIQHAESLIDMEIPYSVFGNNCEHLVTLLRYDDKISDQV